MSDSTAGGSPEPPSHISVIEKVNALQQELALLSGNALLALPDAADVLLQHLGLDLVAIYSFPDDAAQCVPCATLMVAHGCGAAVLERAVVCVGDSTSVGRLRAEGGAAGGRIVAQDASVVHMALPTDFQQLSREAGLRSLAAVAVGPPTAPVGAVLLARQAAGAFDQDWAPVWLPAVSTGMLQHMRSVQVSLAAMMVRRINGAPDRVAAISTLLQSAPHFMLRATNLLMGCRFALLADDGRSALLFEPGRPRRRTPSGTGLSAGGGTAAQSSTGRSASLPLLYDPTADVAVRELPLSNCLLASAVVQRKARFIRNVPLYLQNSRNPARDVVTHATDPVSAVVVVPLLVNEVPFGALYFTMENPCDFLDIQEPLLGFVHTATLVLHAKLAGSVDTLRGLVGEPASTHQSCDAFASVAGGPPSIHAPTGPVSPGDSDPGAPSAAGGGLCDPATPAADDFPVLSPHQSCSGDVVPPLTSFGSTSGRLSKISSNRLCTEAMLRALQQEIRAGKRRSVELSFVADHLIVGEEIGRGGYGSVFHGTWHGRPVAIKVMHARSSDREAVSDAMEMAVLSSLSHPNIVSVYSCLTDMVEVTPSGALGTGPTSGPLGTAHGGPAPRFRRMQPGEEGENIPTYNILVLEFCDRGTLGDAVRKARLFHRRLDNGSIGVDLASAVEILREVVNALQYMHRVNLLHGDVKLDNVLLKTDAVHMLGITPKLADFGLTRILKEDDVVVNHSGAGTVTHLPPEMFMAGSKITTAVDVYAFGIMMYELYTAKRPYAGLSQEAIIERVAQRGTRPIFPAGAPRTYTDLAAACWAADPAARPGLSEVEARLRAVSDELAAQAAAAAQHAAAQQAAAAARAAAHHAVVAQSSAARAAFAQRV